MNLDDLLQAFVIQNLPSKIWKLAEILTSSSSKEVKKFGSDQMALQLGSGQWNTSMQDIHLST